MDKAVVHGTNSMHTNIAFATFNPFFGDFFVVLSFEKVLLVSIRIILNGMDKGGRQSREASVAKLLCSISRDVIHCSLSNPCTGTILATAHKEDRLML
jgi:hypothetical protein